MVVVPFGEVVTQDDVHFFDDRVFVVFHVGGVERGRTTCDDGDFGYAVVDEGVEEDVFPHESCRAAQKDMHDGVCAKKEQERARM